MNSEIIDTQVRLIETDQGWLVLLNSNTLLPVASWWDEDGDPCERDDAVYCVAGTDEFGWLTIELAPPNQSELLN